MKLFKRKASGKPIFDTYESIGKIAEGEEYFEQDPFVSDLGDRKTTISVLGWVFRGFVLLIVLTFGFRLMILQVDQGDQNLSLAEGNRLRVQSTLAPRGIIYDKNGVALIQNTASFALALYPSELPSKSDERKQTIEYIAKTINLEPEALQSKITTLSKRQQTITLLDGIPRDQAISFKLKLDSTPSVELVVEPSRKYSDMMGIGHILGYIGKVSEDNLADNPNLLNNDVIGKAGLELVYDDDLRGVTGLETVEVDSLGRTVRQVGTQDSVIGKSLYLALDSELQRSSAGWLAESMQKSGAKSGSAIVTDVKTGGVIAMVSLPDYNANSMLPEADDTVRSQILTSPDAPMLNRVISGQYPSGSTIKPVVASAALEEKVITPDTKLDTTEGKITIGQWIFPDWKTHGVTDVRQAIADSNNVFFYSLGGGYKNIGGLGIDRLDKYLKLFGFDEKVGIDLPGESKGFIPTPSWKKTKKKENWYIGDTYNLSIGQGDLLTSPMKINLSTVTIANGGKLLKPHLVNEVYSSQTNERKATETTVIRENFISSGNLQVVREGMRRLVEQGLAKLFSGFTVNVAAKTGTAQYAIDKEKTHAWFTSFAPFEDPQIAVTVMVEGGGQGFSAAAPVARNILAQYFNQPITPIIPVENPTP